MRLTSDVLVLAFVFALPACVFEAAACLPAPSAVVSEVCQRALADSPNANGSSEEVCENMHGEGVCVCVLGVWGGGGGQGAADTECHGLEVLCVLKEKKVRKHERVSKQASE